MARVKNGKPDIHLNLNVRGLAQSATLAINERCDQLKKEGKQVYKLGLGQSPFPVPDPVVNELRLNAHQKSYLPVKGLPQLKDAVAAYHGCRHCDKYKAEDVLIGPGSKELMFLLQFVYYGDLVIPTPSWVSYAPQAHIVGRHVRWIPTTKENKWKLTAEELKQHCSSDPLKPRIVILNYPSNPTGLTYSEKELTEIAGVAARHKLILVSDEIYGELHHKGKHRSIARFYPEGTIISGGLSKWCGAGGWRLGTFTFPSSLRWLLDAMAVVASETFTATSAPIQYAAVKAFQGGDELNNYLWKARLILQKLGSRFSCILQDAGISCYQPDGGFYLFPDFSSKREFLFSKGILSSNHLCERILIETGVAMLPGSAFGRPESELTARIAYVDFNGEAAMKAVSGTVEENNVDDDFLDKYCSNTVHAIQLVSDWLKVS
jgi:aspartate aminotransferase